MKFLFQHIALFILLSGFLFSCDRVKETPKPEVFPKLSLNPVSLSLTTTSSIDFNLYEEALLQEGVALSYENPKYGTLEKLQTFGSFRYVPFNTFRGKDVLNYKLCKGQNCKSAVVEFLVEYPSKNCVIIPKNDSLSILNQTTFEIDVLKNDHLVCSQANLTAVSEVKNASLKIEANKIKGEIQTFINQTFSFSYEITDSEGRIYKGNASINASFDNELCKARFEPKADTLYFLNGFYFIVFKKENLLKNDLSCPNDIDPSTFIISKQPANSAIGRLKFEGKNIWYLVKDTANFSTDSFEYQVSTFSGKSASATVLVEKKW